MIGRLVFCIGVLALAGLPTAARAQERPRQDTVFRLKEIVVRATKPIATVAGTSAVEIRIDSLVVSPAPTMESVIRRMPGVHVRTNSRGEAELTVRGSDARQVAVLFDGVPLTASWDSRADVSVIPATAPQEMTLVRGLSSVLHGPNTLGGVVEIKVGHSPFELQEPSLQFTTGMDDNGGIGLSGTIATPVRTDAGAWLIRAGGGYRDTPGAPLARGIAEPAPFNDRDLRLNTDSRNVDGFFAVRYAARGGGWFSLASSTFSAERGIAAELGSSEPRLWRYPTVRRMVAVASGGTGDRRTPFGGMGDLEASVGIDLGRTEIESFATRDYDVIDGTEDGDDRTYTMRLLGDQTLGSRADLRTAFTYVDINHDEVIDDGPTHQYRQRLFSLGGETVFRPVQEGTGSLSDLRLTAGAVLDMGDTPKSGGKPPLGRLTEWGARFGVIAVLGGGATVLHGGVSRRARFPAPRELYSGGLGRFEPNPDLTPETLLAGEVGITRQFGAGDIQAVGFRHHLDDAVVRITTAAGLFRRVNADEIRSSGLELMGSYALGPVALAGDVTLQSVERIEKATGASREPENQPSVFGSASARFPLPLSLRAFTEARFTGRQFCLDLDTGADIELDGGTRFSADLSREFRIRSANTAWISRLEARIGVDNLTDTAIYDQCGLPQPGRLFTVQLRLF